MIEEKELRLDEDIRGCFKTASTYYNNAFLYNESFRDSS